MGLDEHRTDPGTDAAELRERIARTVRALRAGAGRSLADLAAEAGIGKSTLHAIENGEANPGIETLWALARALGVPFGALLDPPVPAVRVVRGDEAPKVAAEASTMEAYLLASTGHSSRIELFDLRLRPGPLRHAQPHSDGTVEHVLVTQGRLRVGPVDHTVDLEVGDLVSFAGDAEHRYEALDDPTRAVLLIEYT
jgi:transcriptional regulator with XRE-family HTH domain